LSSIYYSARTEPARVESRPEIPSRPRSVSRALPSHPAPASPSERSPARVMDDMSESPESERRRERDHEVDRDRVEVGVSLEEQSGEEQQ
ncbi:MAG TPA: hypothetical protein PKC28_15895, partial [Bdellovibrionales bacterium]|nr:hypothetical protein [Bdellovibrionales bacterium]